MLTIPNQDVTVRLLSDCVLDTQQCSNMLLQLHITVTLCLCLAMNIPKEYVSKM